MHLNGQLVMIHLYDPLGKYIRPKQFSFFFIKQIIINRPPLICKVLLLGSQHYSLSASFGEIQFTVYLQSAPQPTTTTPSR
jgi:hypothetical protein